MFFTSHFQLVIPLFLPINIHQTFMHSHITAFAKIDWEKIEILERGVKENYEDLLRVRSRENL